MLFAAALSVALAYAPRNHSLNIASLYEAPERYDETYGRSGWQALRPYIDLAFVGTGESNRRVRAAGLKTALYLDVNLCSARSGPGRNPYASPDCGTWPAGAFYSQDGHPERPLSAVYAASILQRSVDPGADFVRSRVAADVSATLRSNDYDLVELDDATPPSEYYGTLCYGVFGPPYTSAKTCSAAPGGVAQPPYTSRFSRAQWQAGERALVDVLPLPVALNGLAGHAGNEPPAVAEVASAPNAWGAICDTCFYGNGPPGNPYLWTTPILEQRVNAALLLIAAGKNVAVIDEALLEPRERERALAEIMLFYEPDRYWLWAPACGHRSHVPACPESALTFYEPYAGYPDNVAALAGRGGAYAREFAACFDRGRPVGPCAAVVNPERLRAVRMPKLRNAYAHTLAVSGSALCACYGETGAVSEKGSVAPGSLPAASGYVLFR